MSVSSATAIVLIIGSLAATGKIVSNLTKKTFNNIPRLPYVPYESQRPRGYVEIIDIPTDDPDEGSASRQLVGGSPGEQPEIEIMARTIYGEARSEPDDGMLAVGETIMNRLRTNYRGAFSVNDVVLSRLQFSSWNSNDPNLPLMLAVDFSKPNFKRCWKAAEKALRGERILGSDAWKHYYARSIRAPDWASDATETKIIGQHIFLKGVK